MRSLYKEEAENQWNWTWVLEQPATNPYADLKTWIEKDKEGTHKDHLVYFVNNSLAQPKGTQLQQHSPRCLPRSRPPGAPYSFLQSQVTDSVLLYCTEQPNSANTAATTLKSALHLLCHNTGTKARDGQPALGTPVSSWCGCAPSTATVPQVPHHCTPLCKPDWVASHKVFMTRIASSPSEV